jgi:hypothetical protein
MSSPDINPSDWRSKQASYQASSRYIPVSREDSLEVPREELIVVRKQDIEQREQDFERLKHQHRQELERIARQIDAEFRPRAEYLQSLAGTLFGIAAGAAASIPQFLSAPTVSNWVIPTYAVSAIALSLLSLVFVFIDRNLRRARSGNALRITAEIRDTARKEL